MEVQEVFKDQLQKIVRRGQFKTYQGEKIDDLSSYVSQWLEENADHNITIHLGTDCHVGPDIKYRTSLCLVREGKGGHIIDRDAYADKDINMADRLMNEIILSLEVAESIKHLGLDITIHVDYNVNPEHKSHTVYASGISTGAWFGYKTLGKPFAWCASKVADKGTRRKRSRKFYKQRRKAKAKAAKASKV